MADKIIDQSGDWRPIADFPNYEISSLGEIRSLPRVVVQRSGKLQPQPVRYLGTRAGANGYLSTHIRRDGKRYKIKVHLLVARAFLGPPPHGQECRHKNGNRLDPSLINLEYGTRKQNIADAIKHGTFGRLKKNRVIESQRGQDGKFKSGQAVPVSR